jgi:Spy/CpxP family protein refolding chaperone
MRNRRSHWLAQLAGARGLAAAIALAGTTIFATAAIAAEPATAMDAEQPPREAAPPPDPGDEPGRGGWRHGHRRGPPPIERVLEEHAERLALDADTQAAIRAIADASRAEADAHRARLRELHVQMRELLRGDAPDVDAVMRQADAIGAAETQEAKHRLRTMLEIRALLTPAQREALVEIHQERRKHRAEQRRDRD